MTKKGLLPVDQTKFTYLCLMALFLVAVITGCIPSADTMAFQEDEGDVLAHADGMVRFVSEKEILISDFNGNDDFRKKIESKIEG